MKNTIMINKRLSKMCEKDTIQNRTGRPVKGNNGTKKEKGNG